MAGAGGAAAVMLGGIAGDSRALEALKGSAARDPKAALREAAKQFEALFMQELVKSMRAASISSGMLDNGGTELGTELLDAQLATRLTGLPGGLADSIARQLGERIGAATGMAPPKLAWSAPPAEPARTPRMPERAAAAFITRHEAAAQAAQRSTGIPAHFMLGQAAHESGWGAHEIRHADGSPSHNLFGIKAGPGWTGATAEVTTTEYVNGEARKVSAKFRAYASYDEAFRDYAQLLRHSPRYQAALASDDAAGFAQALQRGGYATDPAYADKLTRVINTTLRLARAGI